MKEIYKKSLSDDEKKIRIEAIKGFMFEKNNENKELIDMINSNIEKRKSTFVFLRKSL